jgi:cytochrome c oxidase cbb3-type subunit 3
VLLLIASKRKVMANDNTTGHVWDEDLRELNNPLPRWWMYLFVLTVVFAAVYLAFYPGLGTNPGHAQVEQRRPVRSRAGQGPPGDGAGVRQVRPA